jgi:hypothetical protein
MTAKDKAFARLAPSSAPRHESDQRGDLLARFEGRRKALRSGEHYTQVPLTPDHRDDIRRWIHDLDVMIKYLGFDNTRIV